MKFRAVLILALLVACVALGVNTLEQEFTCPIDGNQWKQRVEISSKPRGLRLDLRQLGEVVDPPTLPVCPKCRFPLFSDKLAQQAGDPTREDAFRRLRKFVLGPDFQLLAAKNPSYFALAQVQQLLDAPPRHIALSYLRASWQVEGREVVSRRLLEKAREHYLAALAGMEPDDRHFADTTLLCGEVERRLGRWDEAEKRFRALAESGMLKGTARAAIPELQLALIARHDAAPHSIEEAAGLAAKAKAEIPKVAKSEEPKVVLDAPPATGEPAGVLQLGQPPKPAPAPAEPVAPADKRGPNERPLPN